MHRRRGELLTQPVLHADESGQGENLAGSSTFTVIDQRLQSARAAAAGPNTAVPFIGDLPAEARAFQALVAADLEIEGVVAKRKASTYQPGVRSPDWLKIKRAGWQEGRVWRG